LCPGMGVSISPPRENVCLCPGCRLFFRQVFWLPVHPTRRPSQTRVQWLYRLSYRLQRRDRSRLGSTRPSRDSLLRLLGTLKCDTLYHPSHFVSTSAGIYPGQAHLKNPTILHLPIEWARRRADAHYRFVHCRGQLRKARDESGTNNECPRKLCVGVGGVRALNEERCFSFGSAATRR